MKAFILAAGRGERLRPLSDSTPKPLMQVGKKTLIEYHLEHLREAGVTEVVINLSWLGNLIREKIGTGDAYDLKVSYSDEGEQALETAGGIIKALPLLADDRFIVINADIWTDYPFKKLIDHISESQAHLILVENPDHNLNGDFGLDGDLVTNAPSYTYSGIGIYTRDFFGDKEPIKLALAPLLREKIEEQQVSGEFYDGVWDDIGTIERLKQLDYTLNT